MPTQFKIWNKNCKSVGNLFCMIQKWENNFKFNVLEMVSPIVNAVIEADKRHLLFLNKMQKCIIK